jgi:hypothetical protein
MGAAVKRKKWPRAARYAGKPCVACGSRSRLRSNGQCHVCKLRIARAWRHELGQVSRYWEPIRVARREALATGALTYNGAPCKHCGGTQRYTSTYTCVPCSAEYERSARRVERKRRAKRLYARKAAAALRAVRELGIRI